MGNKLRILLEILLSFLPFAIAYLLLGQFLSGVQDFGRFYEKPWSPRIQYAWLEFEILSENFSSHTFSVVKVYWIGLLLSFVVIVIGRILAVSIIDKITTNVVKNKKKTR